MATDEDLQEEFSFFNIELSNSEICDKLKELCSIHDIDASQIAAGWVAFFNTHKGKGIKLSCDTLDQFERERLSKKSQKTQRTPHAKKPTAVTPVIYDINSIQDGVDENDAEELYNTYSTTPSSTKKIMPSQKRQLTPDNVPVKRFTNSARSPMVPFSPASFSPAGVTPSRKYSSRSNAGDSVASLGVHDNTVWKGQGSNVSIKALLPMDKNVRYMFQKLTEKAYVLNDIIEELAEQFQTHFNIEEVSHIALPVQDQVTVVGRVCCDSIGKLNAKSVVLEGSRETSAGRCVPVDLSDLKEYSLFPGQVVAMDGINSSGHKFVVKKLYEGISLPLPEINTQSGGNIHLMMAAGPFTTSDSLTYEPLADLAKYIIRDKPDVCILMGPFVDIKNEQIEKGLCTATYEEIFLSQLKQISELSNTGCQFVILPSYRDVHHDYVYPQPPYSAHGIKLSENIHLVQDPCMLSINNLVIGVTSTDILMQLGAEEISCSVPGSSDRLGRLTQHLITQRSFYPLYPPAEEVNIDYESFEVHGRMTVTPHILVLPSDLKQFVKDIKGSCCINPGRLTKGQGGGTYCRVVVNMDTVTSNSSILSSAAAEVLRV